LNTAGKNHSISLNHKTQRLSQRSARLIKTLDANHAIQGKSVEAAELLLEKI
jgi:hypothetical protein